MLLTAYQHIIHELQASDPLTDNQIQLALREQEIDISIEDVNMELSKLIEDGWVEYYGTQNETELAEEEIILGYELSNRWWNLPETARENILIS